MCLNVVLENVSSETVGLTVTLNLSMLESIVTLNLSFDGFGADEILPWLSWSSFVEGILQHLSISIFCLIR